MKLLEYIDGIDKGTTFEWSCRESTSDKLCSGCSKSISIYTTFTLLRSLCHSYSFIICSKCRQEYFSLDNLVLTLTKHSDSHKAKVAMKQ